MTKVTVHRGFSQIEYQQQALNIHYRSAGDEQQPIVICLHPSPLSSAFMLPMLELFSLTHFAVAWDTPGYGDSDKLITGGKTLAEYVDCLALFIDSLNTSTGNQQKVTLYGNATGAQIAIEFAKKYPQKTSQLILENVAWFYDQEREELLENYFPDLTAQSDGSHLAKIWKIVSQLFQYFPWYDTSDSAKLNGPIPPLEVLQQTALDYQKAGAGYANAYIAALNNEKPEQLAGVAVPCQVLLWKDSILHTYCQRLTLAELPDNIVLTQVDSGLEQRMNALKAAIAQE